MNHTKKTPSSRFNPRALVPGLAVGAGIGAAMHSIAVGVGIGCGLALAFNAAARKKQP